MGAGWPAVLRLGPVVLRPLSRSDRDEWVAVRRRNVDWLAPWEGHPPGRPPGDPWLTEPFQSLRRAMDREARRGQLLPFAVAVRGRLVGQVTVSGIVRGASQSAQAGYWIDRDHAGQGITPRALALVVDHCFGPVGLHRVEVNIRPENAASLRVVEKLGLRDEGLRRGLVHIDNAFRDHRSFAVVRDEVPDGLVARLTGDA